ncbi:MAG: hydroxymethylbilane synthase, partial [bacterium]
MSPRTFVIGTRGSRLALRQADIALDALSAAHPAARFELRTIKTEGDRTSASLSTLGGRGVFVIEIERALLAGEIDIAVHSLKDLPTAPVDGLTIGAIPVREDPRDVLIARDGLSLGELQTGALVGTGSPRRVAQLEALGLGLEMTEIRGNVDTRLRKVLAGDLDAVVLAAAGLRRLGVASAPAVPIPWDVCLPAVGQGALAVEGREEAGWAAQALERLHHRESGLRVEAERAFLARLGGGCL